MSEVLERSLELSVCKSTESFDLLGCAADPSTVTQSKAHNLAVPSVHGHTRGA
jgi:hypothetical protein